MTDMLAALYFVRYLDLRRREEEPCREFPPQPRFSVGLGIFRRLRKGLQEGKV